MKMDIKTQFEKKIKDGICDRIEGHGSRPYIEVWPAEDDFGHWVASKERRVRGVICNTPEHKDTPYCGTGYH